MSSGLRVVLTAAAALVGVLVAFAGWHQYQMRAKVTAACQQAQPLVERRAERREVLQLLGPGTEYGAADLPSLARAFASPPHEGASLHRHLQGSNKVVIYSTNDYIRFVHLDGAGRVVEVECFQQ